MVATINAKSIGRTGLTHYQGRIDEEWHTNLSGQKAVEIYREMSDMDASIGAFIYFINTLVKQTSFYANPADVDNEAAVEIAEFLETCIHDMESTWSQFIGEAVTMLTYGHAPFEIVYKKRNGYNNKIALSSRYGDGRIGWKNLEIRSQDSIEQWEIDDDGNILGLWQTDVKQMIPIEKLVLFRNDVHKNNPEGRSILRNAYRSWYFKKKIEELEAVGIERDAAGLPCLEVPPQYLNSDSPEYSSSLLSALEDQMAQLKRGYRDYIIIPCEKVDGIETGFKLRLLGGGGSRQFDVDKTIRRCRSDIMTSVLTSFLLLGQDKVGSFSLASTQTDISALSIGSILDNICETFNKQAVEPLMRINGIDVELWPYLTHGDVEKPELQPLADFVSKLVASGTIIPTEQLENRLLEYAGLPQRKGEEAIG